MARTRYRKVERTAFIAWHSTGNTRLNEHISQLSTTGELNDGKAGSCL